MHKKSFSWGTIILMFIFFFPVGIWMLVRKMNDEKHNYLKNGKSLKTFGWVLFGIGIFYLIMGLTGEFSTEEISSVVGMVIFTMILFCGGGFFMLYKGKQFINRGTKFSRYLAIINNRNDNSIDNIAAAYPTTYDNAVNEIQQMIDAQYILNSYIDLNKRELVMQNNNYATNNAIYNHPEKAVAAKPRTVKCADCGATNSIIVGQSEECEYCGSPL